jgi:hypothetical protein
MANAFEGVQGLEIDTAELKLEYILPYLNTPRVLCRYISRCRLLKVLQHVGFPYDVGILRLLIVYSYHG